nr:hypothetical protein [Tanacetum cinerariifolium]
MTYPVTILTLDNARSYVMHGASFTQGIVSSIPIGGSISHGSFLPFILLLVVIMVTVVIVVVMVILVVVVVVKVVIAIIEPLGYVDNFLISFYDYVVKFVFHLLDLSSRTILICQESFQFGPSDLVGFLYANSWAYAFHQDKASSVRVPVANFPLFATRVSLVPEFLIGLSAFAMAAACASRTAATPSVISCRITASVIAGVADSAGGIINLIDDKDPTNEDGDAEMDDSTGVLVSLGEISLEGKKYWELDIGDCDNTGDGGKTAGRAIINWGGKIALYACMASIYGSSCKGEKISMSKRYLLKSFEVLGELFLGIVRK